MMNDTSSPADIFENVSVSGLDNICHMVAPSLRYFRGQEIKNIMTR